MERVLILGSGTGDQSLGPNAILLEMEVANRIYRILIDCGMEFGSDGREDIRLPNFSYLEKQGLKLDAVYLTHGHSDHVGGLPELAKRELLTPDTKIFASPQTRQVARIVINDTQKFQPERYTIFHYSQVLLDTRYVDFVPGEHEVFPGIKVFAVPAGHVPGATSLIFRLPSGRNALITGDICWHDQPVVKGAPLLSKVLPSEWLPDLVLGTDLTYGAEERKPWEEQVEGLIETVERTAKREGRSIVYAFGVGRAQNMLFELVRAGIDLPIYADGVVREIFGIFQKENWSSHDQNDFGDILSKIHFVENFEHRRELLFSSEPMVVVTTSGMADGGPAPDYLRYTASRKEDTAIFTSYLAPRSLGAKMVEVARKRDLALAKERSEEERSKVIETISLPLFDPDAPRNEVPRDFLSMPLRAEVKRLSFSAHGDLSGLEACLWDVNQARSSKLETIVLTHGISRTKRVAASRFASFAKTIVYGEEGTVLNLD